ncbi:MAG: hypothetical protein IJ604_10815 [Prevotella sp.]|nr:hypothetical protein [Prevotella sp.]
MKRNQTIVRIMTVLVIAFGVETTASAQFGKLKGMAEKAKKAVKEKVENAKNNATTTVTQQTPANGSQTQQVKTQSSTNDGSEYDFIRQNNARLAQERAEQAQQENPTPPAGVVYIIDRKDEVGYRLKGKYNKTTKIFMSSRDSKVSYQLKDDGTVVSSQGELAGSISASGEMVNPKGAKFQLKDNKVYVNGTEVGVIENDTTAMVYPGATYVTTEPMDKALTAFIVWGLLPYDTSTLDVAAKNAKRIDKESDEQAAFGRRAAVMTSKQAIVNPSIKPEMDQRDYYVFIQNKFGAKENGYYWCRMDDLKAFGYDPAWNWLVDNSGDRIGKYVNGVVYNLKGAKLGAISSAGVVTNAAGKTVGRIVKGSFKGTAFSSKGQTYNHKLVDAAGKQVGLVNADANPNLVAAWAFLMFAKK